MTALDDFVFPLSTQSTLSTHLKHNALKKKVNFSGGEMLGW